MNQLKSTWSLFSYLWRRDFSSIDKFSSPLLLSVIIALIFTFTFPEFPKEYQARVFTAQSILVTFFSIQMYLSRSFEFESSDRIYEWIRTSPLSPYAFISAKMMQVIGFGLLVVVANLILASLLFSGAQDSLWNIQSAMMMLLSVIGVSTVGVLVAVISLKAKSKQILFTLLFFPLVSPVLICASESWIGLLETGPTGEMFWSWITVLLLFDVIYLTLVYMLGTETLAHS